MIVPCAECGFHIDPAKEAVCPVCGHDYCGVTA